MYKLLESHSSKHWLQSEYTKEDFVGKMQREILNKWDIMYRFTHPYTILGTIIGIISVSLLPLESTADLSLPLLVGLLKALVPTVLMNIYSSGLNHLFDVEIDKVNKPRSPLASGELSMKSGIVIVSTTLATSLSMVIMFQSPPMLYGLLVSFVVASAYSTKLPLLRWKSNPFLAATTIVIARGIVIQVAIFIHIQKYVLGRQFAVTRSLVFAVAIFSLFSLVIALMKDVPDVEGDRDHGVQSFSVLIGKEMIFWLGIRMLLIGYGSAMVFGAASSSCLTNKLVTVLGHGALASSLWLRARSVNLDRKASITSVYMFVWKLFYAEYLLIHFAR